MPQLRLVLALVIIAANIAAAMAQAQPKCPNNVTTVASDGVVRKYLGTDPTDPLICLLQSGADMRHAVWGYYSLESRHGRDSDLKRAVTIVMTGGFGATSSVSWPVGQREGIDTSTLKRLPNETILVGNTPVQTIVIHADDLFGHHFETWIREGEPIIVKAKGDWPSPYDWHLISINPV
jgi:hypothetical protein